jgi:hypothetical protein
MSCSIKQCPGGKLVFGSMEARIHEITLALKLIGFGQSQVSVSVSRGFRFQGPTAL